RAAITPIDMQPHLQRIRHRELHDWSKDLADRLDARLIPDEGVRGSFIGPAEETRWGSPREIGRQNVPHLHIRHAQAHRDELEEGVDRIDHQCLDASLREFLRQMFRTCAEQATQPLADAPARYVEAMEL